MLDERLTLGQSRVMYKIIGADEKEYGPIPAEVVRQWLAEGRANAQTKVLLEGTTEWKPLSAFPELSGGMSAAPPVFPSQPLPTTAGLDQVNGPAIGLIITAILGFFMQAASLVGHLVMGASFMGGNQMQNEALAKWFSGTIGVGVNIIGMLVSGLILVGGLKMRKLENYGLVMAATIIAMIPCISPCCLIGLPIGIWALVVLSKPEVKSTFH